MKSARLILCALLIVSLVGCGLKRDLEKPGEDKYKRSTPDAVPPVDDDNDPALMPPKALP